MEGKVLNINNLSAINAKISACLFKIAKFCTHNKLIVGLKLDLSYHHIIANISFGGTILFMSYPYIIFWGGNLMFNFAKCIKCSSPGMDTPTLLIHNLFSAHQRQQSLQRYLVCDESPVKEYVREHPFVVECR